MLINEINLYIPFKQKNWHWVNNKKENVYCKCGDNVSFNRNWLDGYREYCSPKCAQIDLKTKEKRKKTNIDKWGYK